MKNIQSRLAKRAQGKQPSPIRDLMRYLTIDGMISLGGGYPNPATFGFENLTVTFKGGHYVALTESELITATQYGPSDVLQDLKRILIGWHHHKDGIVLEDSQIVTLNGAQEGLFIMAYLFLDEDDWVVLSEPSYPGAIAAFRSFTKNFIAVPLDKDGIQTEVLEIILKQRQAQHFKMPKFIYTIPNGHNPGGVALAPPRRRHLIELAEEYDLLILEDDPYQLIKLEDTEPLLTVQALDSHSRVVRLDSFSKILAPGLRLGYASGAPAIIQQFIYFKQAANMHTSSLVQMLLLHYLRKVGYAGFQQRIRENCQLYKLNRDAMLQAVPKYLPTTVKFNIPAEGMFVWLELPRRCNAKRMIDNSAADLKVVLVPGPAFSTQNGLAHFMRASFSLVPPDKIEEGIRRFGEMIGRELG